MKRPLLIIAVGYIIGIVWGLYCKCSIALFYAILFPICFFIKTNLKSKNKFKIFSFKRLFRYIKIIFKINVILTIIITSLISNSITMYKNYRYDNLYNNIKDISLEGIIVSNTKSDEYSTIYKVKVINLNNNRDFKNTYLLLNINNSIKVKLDFGDKVTIKGEYIKPKAQRNYKSFNYKNYLKTQKIYGSVKVSNVIVQEKEKANYIFIISNKIFLYIKSSMQKLFDEDTSNLILGLILGYTDELSSNIKQDFKNSNMLHILAVSGLHITFINNTVICICNNAVGKRKSKIISFFTLIVYMLIIGFAPSIVRACIMNITLLLSSIIHRKNDVWSSISLSALCILVYNPFLITSIGFLLSYGGTLGIIMFNKSITNALESIKIRNHKLKYKYKYIIKKNIKVIKHIQETLAVSLSAQIVIWPIIAVYYNTVGISFLFTSLAISVIIEPLIIAGFIAIILAILCPQILKIFSFIIIGLIQVLIIISKNGSRLPFNNMYITTPYILEIILYYTIIILINFLYKIYHSKNITAFEYRVRNTVSLIKYRIRLNKYKIISFILIACILFSFITITPQKLKVFFIDVGQGDCTLIQTPMKHTILIDGGGSLNDSFNVGENVLLPYLLDRRINKIDYIIISHFDQDHIRTDY